eukprot:6481951-Amphidinium_carterae.1
MQQHFQRLVQQHCWGGTFELTKERGIYKSLHPRSKAAEAGSWNSLFLYSKLDGGGSGPLCYRAHSLQELVRTLRLRPRKGRNAHNQ